MSLSPENELTIRRAIAEKLAGISGVGFIIPAPIYFADKADFFNQISLVILNTQKLIETSLVKFCAVYPIRFEDVQTSNFSDEPEILLTYEFYLFHERNSARADESGIDSFNKTILKTHNDFCAAYLRIREAFLGKQYLTGTFAPSRYGIMSKAKAERPSSPIYGFGSAAGNNLALPARNETLSPA